MRTGRVLVIIEDEPDVRLLIRTKLMVDPRIELDGQTDNITDAVELARTSQPGVIILDHSLHAQEMTGLEGAPLLKEASPNSKILLFTAFDLEQEASDEPAVDEFLSKARIADLLPTVQRLLDLDPL